MGELMDTGLILSKNPVTPDRVRAIEAHNIREPKREKVLESRKTRGARADNANMRASRRRRE